MTLSLNYNDDLSRVQIGVAGPPSGTTVHIERSTNELYWETVRGGAAVPVVGGVASLDDYEFGADAVNYYRYTGEAPDPVGAAANDEAGSDPAVAPSVTAPTSGLLVCAWTSFEYTGAYTLPGSMTAITNLSGGAFASSAVAVEPVAAGATGTRSATAGQADQWSACTAVLPGDVTVIDTAWDYQADTATVEATVDDAEAGDWLVAVHAMDWDTSGDAAAPAGSGWVQLAATAVTSDASRTLMWAREVTEAGSQTVTIGGVGAASDTYLTVLLVSGLADGTETASITPDLDGRAWLKSIKHPFLNRPIHRVLAGGGQSISRASRGAVFDVQGRSVPVAVTDIRSSREFTLTIQVPDEAAARDMDLTLASGDVFFLQIPPELAPHMTGGYVRIGESTQHREADTIMWRFTIPCTVVAPPGPGVVGTTMTWGGVFRLYGSWDALVASNPTWGDLLATVGSPDDLVVL